MQKISVKWLLLFAQMIAHGALVYQIFYGTALDWFLTILIYFCFSCLGLTMTLHRWLSHMSWHPPAWFQKIGLFFASACLMGSPLSWVAMHREHHRHTDTENDPHSPQFKPWWYVTWLVMFANFPQKTVGDLLKNKFVRFVHKHYFTFHYVFILLTFLIPKILIPLYLAPAALCWLSGGLVVSLNHLSGYRNFDTNDKSKNNILTGFFSFGEGWHNNHHYNPNSPIFSKKWWEIDIGGMLILLIQEKK